MGAIFFIPFNAKVAVSTPYPLNNAPTIGTIIRAVSAEVVLVRIKRSRMIMIKIAVSIRFYFEVG